MIQMITFEIESTSGKYRYNSLRVQRLNSEAISLGSSFETHNQFSEFFVNSYLAKKQYPKLKGASYRSRALDIILDTIMNDLNKFILNLDSKLMLRSLSFKNLPCNIKEFQIAVASMISREANWASQRFFVRNPSVSR